MIKAVLLLSLSTACLGDTGVQSAHATPTGGYDTSYDQGGDDAPTGYAQGGNDGGGYGAVADPGKDIAFLPLFIAVFTAISLKQLLMSLLLGMLDGKVVPQDCSASDAIHGSIGFAIDNTGSVSSSSTGIMSLSNGVVEEVITRTYIIPQWVLTTFNDISEEVVDNVELRVTTDDVDVFRTSLNSISFFGGGDGPERATQGLLVTLQNMPRHGVVVLFTDHLTKNLELETDLLALRDEKEIKIFIILAPQYNGQVGDLSWELYKRLSEGRIYNVVDFNKTLVVDEVVQVVGEDCEGSRLPISGGRATF